MLKIKNAEFVISATDYKKCPQNDTYEFAFIGRSNVGKSSLINMLTNRKSLAKTSSTPGKTQLINHFIINDSWYLVDLPGYGYAKAAKTERRKWEKFISNYLTNRPNLINLFVYSSGCKIFPGSETKSLVKFIPFKSASSLYLVFLLS